MNKELKTKVENGLKRSRAEATAEHKKLVPQDASPRPDQTKIRADRA